MVLAGWHGGACLRAQAWSYGRGPGVDSVRMWYDPHRDLSDVVILDAQDFAGEPAAMIVCLFACRSAPLLLPGLGAREDHLLSRGA